MPTAITLKDKVATALDGLIATGRIKELRDTPPKDRLRVLREMVPAMKLGPSVGWTGVHHNQFLVALEAEGVPMGVCPHMMFCVDGREAFCGLVHCPTTCVAPQQSCCVRDEPAVAA